LKINNNVILWGNFYSFIIMGMLTLFFGTSMNNIRLDYGLSFEQGGLILSTFAAGSLTFSFLCGVLGDLLGMKKVLIFAHICFLMGIFTIYLSTSSLLLYLGTFLIGAGLGAGSTSVNIVVNDFVHGDGKIMSLLHMCFGIGALLIPAISSKMLMWGFRWKSVLIIMAILEIIAIFITIKMEIPKNDKHPDDQRIITRKAFGNIRLYIFMAILFFYVGAENAFNGWVVTYLTEGVKLSEEFSQQMLSLFWVVMMFGRYLNSLISRKVLKETILLVSSIGAAVMMLFFVTASYQELIITIIIVMGLMFSGVYPITVANANPIIRGSALSGALLGSAGSLGSVFIPYVSGIAAEKTGVKGIMVTVFASLAIMSIFALINKKFQLSSDTPSVAEEIIL